MKFEVSWKLLNGAEKSFITKEYNSYNPERKKINGLYQIGFVKEGKTRNTWIPFKCGEEYTHNVKEITIQEATTGRIIERIECEM